MSQTTATATRPTIRLKPGARKKYGAYQSPWLFANDVAMSADTRALEPGTVVRATTDTGKPLGTYFFNRHPLICARRLSPDPEATIDTGFWIDRLREARDLRHRLIGGSHYRLVHAEGDRLPGTVIDRFGDVVVLQVNTAGIEAHLDDVLTAVDEVLSPRAIVLRNDSQARELERLDSYVKVAKGRVDGPVEIEENGAVFYAQPLEGQKTGWFYDQRDNRAFAARMATGARVLDGYSFSGGFAIQAALGGAHAVVAVDRSQAALDAGASAAERNGVAERCRFDKADIFDDLPRRAGAGESFDLVIMDPPAFVKSRKDYWQGIKGYRKLTKLAAPLVRSGGTLMMCSCSHHVQPDAFADQVRRGLAEARREGRVLRFAGAGPDHPVHPWLPETSYLKALALTLD